MSDQKETIENLKTQLNKFKTEFEKVTRAKTPFEIKHFVIGQHESRWKQWYQLCIETDAKYRAIQETEGNKRLTELEIEELELSLISKPKSRLAEIGNEKIQIQIGQKKNQLAHINSLMIGAFKEVSDYLALAENEYPEFWGKSEDELVAAHEEDYWNQRLSRQIAVDLMTFGRIQAGNITCLLQLGEKQKTRILMMALSKSDQHTGIANRAEKVYQDAVADKVMSKKLVGVQPS
jgi:hypothetical protein